MPVRVHFQEGDTFFDLGAATAPSRSLAVQWKTWHLLQNRQKAYITYRFASWGLPHQRCASVSASALSFFHDTVTCRLSRRHSSMKKFVEPTTPSASTHPSSITMVCGHLFLGRTSIAGNFFGGVGAENILFAHSLRCAQTGYRIGLRGSQRPTQSQSAYTFACCMQRIGAHAHTVTG